jgi:hypothetical protein
MISGQDWSDSATWLGLALAMILLGLCIYAVIIR